MVNKATLCVFITTVVLSSITFVGSNEAFAFLGFGLFGGNTEAEEDQSTSTTSQSSTSVQNARCYSQADSIIDSCNSGDSSNSENTGYSSLGQ